MAKICRRCQLLQDIEEFYLSRSYRSHICKTCEKNRIQERYQQNKTMLQMYGREHYRRNPLKYKQNTQQYRQNPLNKKRRNSIHKLRMLSDVQYRIRHNLRGRIKQAIRTHTKTSPTLILIGCPIKELQTHLETRFQVGMSWDNYGQWHIDHIKPCSSFDLSDPQEQKECFNYTNLQPLWAKDNLIKGRKILI